MSDIRQTAVRVTALKVLQDRVGAVYKVAKAELDTMLDAGDRKSVVLDDGTKLGSVYKTDPELKPKVTNARHLLAWVKGAAPTEVEQVEQVRESYVKALLARVVRGNETEAINPKTGEVVDGVTFEKSAGYTAARPDADAVESSWRSGAMSLLDVIGLAVLPAGVDDPEALRGQPVPGEDAQP